VIGIDRHGQRPSEVSTGRRPTVSAGGRGWEAGVAIARDRTDVVSRGIDLADHQVPGVGYENVAGRIDGNRGRPVEHGAGRRATVARVSHTAGSCDGCDGAAGDLANTVIAAVSNI